MELHSDKFVVAMKRAGVSVYHSAMNVKNFSSERGKFDSLERKELFPNCLLVLAMKMMPGVYKGLVIQIHPFFELWGWNFCINPWKPLYKFFVTLAEWVLERESARREAT